MEVDIGRLIGALFAIYAAVAIICIPIPILARALGVKIPGVLR